MENFTYDRLYPKGESSSSVEVRMHAVNATSLADNYREAKQATDNVKERRYDYHMRFLSGGRTDFVNTGQVSALEEVKNAPLFSGTVLDAFSPSLLPQYGLFARIVNNYQARALNLLGSDGRKEPEPVDARIFLNVNTPWSAFICGSQGSGKSHTLSCMLENCLLPSPLGELPRPLAAIIFHFDKFTSYASSQVCEAAYLCSSGIPVRVLVSPTNLWNMKKAYQELPGLPLDVKMPEVIPLLFQEGQLNVSRIMTMMAINKNDAIPLYIEVMLRILRQMTTESQGAPGLNYGAFRNKLAMENLTTMQNGPLKLRLDLMEGFMEDNLKFGAGLASTSKPAFPDNQKGRKAARHWDEQAQSQRLEREAKAKAAWSFPPGSLTIVDLSSPFVDESSACALFNICLELFLESRGDVGRVVALDEAHKFMTDTDAASTFTDNLLQVIRQQRHLATRVIIATQEPTISPKLLDLSTMTIVLRFSSPDWFATLRNHLAGVSDIDIESKRDAREIFKNIVSLQTGEALLFSPTTMLDLAKDAIGGHTKTAERLGIAYVKMRIRKRLTADGGRSILAV